MGAWVGLLIVLLSALLSVTSAAETLRKHGCSPFADVLFIIDGSESITRMDFTKMKDYVKREVQALNIFPKGARVGVIVYSDDVSSVIPFSDNRDVTDLEIAIEDIKQPRLGTNTALALQEARTLFSSRGRPDAAKIAVLITDGDVKDKASPRAAAKSLRDADVNIIAVGVGKDVVQEELVAMASKPEWVKRVDTFSGLENLKLPYLEVCPDNTTPPLGPNDPDAECRIDGNIIFIFDGSESISVSEEATMKNFVKDQIDLLGLGSGKAGMGLVMFSNEATIEIRLSNTISAGRLKQEVDNLRLPGEGSNIARGIEVMHQMFGRSDRNKIAVLITDGVSMDKGVTIDVADRAKRDGVEIVTIGVGSPEQIDYDELNSIATSSDHVFTPATFDEFVSVDFASKLSVPLNCGTTPQTTRSTWSTPTRRITTQRPWTTTPRVITTARTRTWTRPPRITTPRRPTPRRTTPRRTTPRRTTPRRTTPRRTTPRRITQRRTTPNPSINFPECDKCRIEYGSGFNRHAESCEKFVRCKLEFLENGGYRVVGSTVYDCPRGLFWNQDTLTCQYPNEVDCPLDKCRTEQGLRAYADPFDCGMYWVCLNGISASKLCCPPGQSFDESRSECVPDSSCSSRMCAVGGGGGACPFAADSSDETYFVVVVNGKELKRQCGAGLAYDSATCGCHRRIAPPTEQVLQGCQPDVYLPMDEDFLDHSGRDRAVGNDAAVVEKGVSGAVGGGAGKFDGSDSVWIYRYNNMEFPPYVEIRFRFQELQQPSGTRSGPEALVTNGNCGEEPSIAVSSQRGRGDVTFFTETTSGSATTTMSYRNGWTDVTYIYDRTQLTGTLSSASPQSEDLSGVIRRTHSPIILGQGTNFQNFTGYIDEFYVYFCKP